MKSATEERNDDERVTYVVGGAELTGESRREEDVLLHARPPARRGTAMKRLGRRTPGVRSLIIIP